MSSSAYHVRRATIDDLPALLGLWGKLGFPAAELEPRLTEFQLVENDDHELLGAIGMEIIDRHGRLHSEAFNDFALADILRDQLWHRMQSVAANRGLARMWHSEAVPFWRQNGFQPAGRETLKKLPAAWASLPIDWVTLQLRDEDALKKTLEVDFDQFKQEQQREMSETLRRARFWKTVAIALSSVVAIVAVVFSIYLLINYASRFRR